MQKSFIVILFITVCTFCTAQTYNSVVGVGVGSNWSSIQGFRSGLNLNYGKFKNERLLLGVSTHFNNKTSDFFRLTQGANVSPNLVGVFKEVNLSILTYGKYFITQKGRLLPSIDAEMGFLATGTGFSDEKFTVKRTFGFETIHPQLNLGLGLTYFVTKQKNLALDFKMMLHLGRPERQQYSYQYSTGPGGVARGLSQMSGSSNQIDTRISLQYFLKYKKNK
jgi:hypothetical protein